MATSDWSSTYTDGAVSANRSLSPIAVSTSSPQDSGNSSPHSPDFARDSIEQAEDMNETPRERSHVAEYQKEIQDLREQIQKLQEAGNVGEYSDSTELRRKLARIEEEHAEKIRESNEEIMGLQSQIAKLRSAVEKGEANRQKLEYDLTIANMSASQEKRMAAERESALQKTVANLKEHINQLKKQLQNVGEALEETRQTGKNEEHKTNQLLAEKGSPSHTPFRSTTPTSSLSPARRSLYLPSTDLNPIGSLQEMCMKKNWNPPVYNVTQEEGEAHMTTFTFECTVEDWISQGHGSSKKAAKKLAAEKMLSMISEAPKGSSPVGAHKNGSSSPLSKSLDKHSRLSPLSGSSPSRSSQSNSPVPFLSSDLYDKMETEEPCLNTVSHHCSTPPSVVDAETSVSHEFCSALEDEGKTSGFTVTYHDLPEKGYDGNYMCFVRLDTKPPTVCGGMGHKKQAAHEKAAKNALYYLSTVFSH